MTFGTSLVLLAVWTKTVRREGDFWHSLHTHTHTHTQNSHSNCTVHFIVDFSITRKPVGSFTPLWLYPRKKQPPIKGWVCSQPVWMLWRRDTFLALKGNERISRSSIPKPIHHNDWTATAFRNVKTPCLNSGVCVCVCVWLYSVYTKRRCELTSAVLFCRKTLTLLQKKYDVWQIYDRQPRSG